MKIVARDKLIAGLVLSVTLILAVWIFGYHPGEFKGGLGVHDSGFWSYPRYEAQLGDVPLWKNGEYRFVVRGLPPGPLDLELRVLDATDSDRAQLTTLSTVVTASVIDGSGDTTCAVAGNLSGSRDDTSWMLASSSSGASFWQPGCQHLPISRFKEYTLKLNVSGTNDRSPHITLRSVLRGGGNELP